MLILPVSNKIVAYPSLDHVDDAWLERALTSASVTPSTYLNSWPLFGTLGAPWSFSFLSLDSTAYPTNSRPSKPSYFFEGSKLQKADGTVVVPPQLPASAFIDASSPDAWTPRVASSPIPVPVAQPAPVVLIQQPSEELGSNSVSSSPVKRPDIESELNKQNLYKTELCRNWVCKRKFKPNHPA